MWLRGFNIHMLMKAKGAEELVVSYFISLWELMVEQRQGWLVKCKKRASKDRKLYRIMKSIVLKGLRK